MFPVPDIEKYPAYPLAPLVATPRLSIFPDVADEEVIERAVCVVRLFQVQVCVAFTLSIVLVVIAPVRPESGMLVALIE